MQRDAVVVDKPAEPASRLSIKANASVKTPFPVLQPFGCFHSGE
jgi:hypothetical protein